MIKKVSLLLLSLLFLQGAEALYAQGSLLSPSAGSLGFRLDGGVQYAVGAGQAKGPTAVQPMGGIGLFYNINPRFRAGLDYNYSRMIRETSNGTLSKLPDGGVAGDVYRDQKTHFHSLSATGEYNLLAEGPVSLYAGAGVGAIIAAGKVYTLGVKNEIKPGGAGNSIQITGHNESHSFVSPFIPVSFTLEYEFLPQVAVCFEAGYRFVIAGKNEFSPNGQAFGLLGLRFNL